MAVILFLMQNLQNSVIFAQSCLQDLSGPCTRRVNLLITSFSSDLVQLCPYFYNCALKITTNGTLSICRVRIWNFLLLCRWHLTCRRLDFISNRRATMHAHNYVLKRKLLTRVVGLSLYLLLWRPSSVDMILNALRTIGIWRFNGCFLSRYSILHFFGQLRFNIWLLWNFMIFVKCFICCRNMCYRRVPIMILCYMNWKFRFHIYNYWSR